MLRKPVPIPSITLVPRTPTAEEVRSVFEAAEQRMQQKREMKAAHRAGDDQRALDIAWQLLGLDEIDE